MSKKLSFCLVAALLAANAVYWTSVTGMNSADQIWTVFVLSAGAAVMGWAAMRQT